MKTLTKAFEMPAHSLEEGQFELNTLSAGLPTLEDNPDVNLKIISRYLQQQGFSYQEGIASLTEVMSSKAGSCLGLSVLVTSLLLKQEKSPECKVLIRPLDAVNKADQKLFAELMAGEYFDYECPVLPTLRDQPPLKERINRFIPLAHPIVILEGVPLETTMMLDGDANPVIEYPSESSTHCGVQALTSHVLSDQAKKLFAGIGKTKSAKSLDLFWTLVRRSIDLHPINRDALIFQWHYGKRSGDHDIQENAKAKLLQLGTLDSDLSYKLWIITGDTKYLDLSLEQFPEHICAFLDRKVFLEPDPKEARMNLAVALWCITYSSTFELKDFLCDSQVKMKIKELF